MKELELGELRITVTHTREAMRVDWRGHSRARDPDETLSPFLKEVVDYAVACKVHLDIHFEEMMFSNSATITTVMRFIKSLRDRDASATVSFSSKKKWQRVLADGLGMFDQGNGRLRLRPVA